MLKEKNTQSLQIFISLLHALHTLVVHH
uniref:Uncharacterized protein n=1 Tax=Arundo donax TaxID=35708 RepID=A0A0A9AYJ7_ARUDO